MNKNMNTASNLSKREKIWRNPFKRRNNGNNTRIKYQLSGFIAFVGLLHNHLSTSPAIVFKGFKQFASFRLIISLSGIQWKCHCCLSICYNPMNFGCPSGSWFTDKLFTVFLIRPYHLDGLLLPCYREKHDQLEYWWCRSLAGQKIHNPERPFWPNN